MKRFVGMAFRKSQFSGLNVALNNMRRGECTVFGTCVKCQSPVFTIRLRNLKARWQCWNSKCQYSHPVTFDTKREPAWFTRDDGVAERYKEPLP